MKFMMCLLLASSFAAAADRAFDLSIDLNLNGKNLDPIELTVEEGKKQTITRDLGSEKTYVDIVATEDSLTEDGLSIVNMKFEIGKIDKQGKKTVISTPSVITIENQTAQISQSDKQRGENLTLSVTPVESL